MKNILFIATAICTSFVFSQEMEKNSSWSLGLNFAQTYGYRTLNYTAPNEFIQELRNEAEGGQFGFQTNLRLIRQINTKWSLELGAGYASRNYQIKKEEFSNENSTENNIVSIQSNVQFRYWEIPLVAKYNFYEKGTHRFYLMAGLNGAKFRTQLTQTNLVFADGKKENYTTHKNGGFNYIDVAPQIGLGWTCVKNEKFRIDLSPFFQYSLLSVEGQKNQKENLFHVGVNIGVVFEF